MGKIKENESLDLNIDFQIKRVKKIAIILAGFTVLALGAVGMVTPLPGILLTFIGLTLLSAQFLWARRAVKRIKLEANNLKNSAQNKLDHLRKKL